VEIIGLIDGRWKESGIAVSKRAVSERSTQSRFRFERSKGEGEGIPEY
jgi:hypothetical protein